MNVGIIGASGYGGVELIRFLNQHPKINSINLYTSSEEGVLLTNHYPHLRNGDTYKLRPLVESELSGQVDTVFLATPPGVSSKWSQWLLDQGIRVIDLSGDLRLHSQSIYETWYKREAASASLIKQATYGLSEWNKETIQTAQLIANPGCFPTAILLALGPVLQAELIDPTSIIIDAKTGTSGAGKSPTQMTHFSEMNENFKIYGVASHKHTPEIEQELTSFTNEEVKVSFQPHLVPMVRGIMATIYASGIEGVTNKKLYDCLKQAYEQHSFIRIRDIGDFPQTKHVYGSNYCDIGVAYDERTNRVILVSVIDNLVKGAAGQAIQNMNLMNEWDEHTGLTMLPIYP
ncbi:MULTISPECIES: N-acetyl-gamma-glutamyl-phosphate reductase [Shouchella]|uniref:N-acetyl-gamma-glutamyl-phosphate reductase n=2 Tax=Shouchella TaxID=2893057 RepID=A0ABY7W7I7_9BACI|nr:MULTISPECIES: N-acetyl-gamma-glutamyl-phosphate reductase [Shouchella]MED4127613.1 N-acetyl-gamma-glutamyl-phosphate reductase [Shouchella miscanthi]WDF04051.1 N-acetyl-gamma-glutamyl-phosphate reductase [Shouchella hunanensis]GAF22419.1 N-acetyl-gamma-glutamyl-phosphate reductase [Bacillus sp. JCM 19047]